MKFDDLPQDVQHEIQARVFRIEIEADEDDRRMYNTFGYNRGGMPVLFMCLFVPFVLSGFTIIGLAMFYVPNHDTSMTTSPLLWWVLIPPFALLPVTPFVFLKPRFALRALGIIIAVFVVLTLIVSGFDAALGALV